LKEPSEQETFDSKRANWIDKKNLNEGKRIPTGQSAKQKVTARATDMTESKQFKGHFWPLAYFVQVLCLFLFAVCLVRWLGASASRECGVSCRGCESMGGTRERERERDREGDFFVRWNRGKQLAEN